MSTGVWGCESVCIHVSVCKYTVRVSVCIFVYLCVCKDVCGCRAWCVYSDLLRRGYGRECSDVAFDTGEASGLSSTIILG